MQKIKPENIDYYHREYTKNISKEELNEIYTQIVSHPIRYLASNQYLKKFIFYVLIPFIIIVITYNEINFIFKSKIIDVFAALAMIWVWYNRNTFYIIIKILMIIYSIFPFTNTYYHVSGKILHYKFIKYLFFIVSILISIQLLYQIVFS